MVKDLENERGACKSFRIRRSGGFLEVLIVKDLARRSCASTEDDRAAPSRLPSELMVNRASGLRRQDGNSFLLRD
jgi:hypothetical protein